MKFHLVIFSWGILTHHPSLTIDNISLILLATVLLHPVKQTSEIYASHSDWAANTHHAQSEFTQLRHATVLTHTSTDRCAYTASLPVTTCRTIVCSDSNYCNFGCGNCWTHFHPLFFKRHFSTPSSTGVHQNMANRLSERRERASLNGNRWKRDFLAYRQWSVSEIAD